MAGYTKLFNSILASTIWLEDDKTRIVWITLLAMADKDGIAEGSLPGIAGFAHVSVEDCQAAMEKLSSPDEYSRSKEFEGRRIEAIDGGWRLLNHEKYRRRLSADERREYLKLKQREYRKRDKSTSVNNVSDTDTVLTQAEADTEAKADTKAGRQERPAALDARSKRPIFKGQRFVVHEWQLEDLVRMLGAHANAFDLHDWFFQLDASAVASADVIPQRDGGQWLQSKTMAEAQRRGIAIASSEPPKSGPSNKRIAGLLKGGEAFLKARGVIQ